MLFAHCYFAANEPNENHVGGGVLALDGRVQGFVECGVLGSLP